VGVIKRQGIKNIVITYVGVIIGAISAIFLQPAFLSSTELGFTRNLYNFSFLLSIALPLGLPNIILRFFPQYKEGNDLKKYFFGFILFYFLIASVFSLSIFLIFKTSIIELYKTDSELFVSYFFCVIPYALIIALNSSVTCYSQAVFKSTVPSFLNDVFSRVLVVLITVLYYYKWISFNQYVLFFVLIYFLVTLILIAYLMQYDLISFRIKKSVITQIEFKKALSYGLILCVISFTSYGLKSIDAIFLGLSSLSNVAVYSTAVFLAMFIEVPLGSIERISHSKIAENFSTGNYSEMEKIYSESVKYLLIFGGLIFLGINACSKYIFEFLPEEYSQSVHLVMILSFGCLVNVSTGVNNAILFYTNHFKMGGILLVLAFTLTVVLDLLFIPSYGMTAAAIVTASVSIIYNLAKFLMIYKEFGFQPYNRKSLKISVIIFICFVIVWFLPNFSHVTVINILINGSIISLIYIYSIYKINVIPEIFDSVKARFIKS
jgi:O-antigen/teichoic acid export membrane protein